MFRRQRWALYLIIIICFFAAFGAIMGMNKNGKPTKVSTPDGSMQLTHAHADDEYELSEKYPVSRFSAVVTPRAGVAVQGVKMYYMTGEKLLDEIVPSGKKLSISDFSVEEMVKGNADFFTCQLKGRERTRKYYYFIEAVDSTGARLAACDNRRVTGADQVLADPANLYRSGYKSEVPFWHICTHIVLGSIALVFLIHSLYYSLHFLVGGVKGVMLLNYASIFWGVILFFIANFPLGWWTAYETYGVAWGGWPLGNDITDNKTLVTLIYWMILIPLMPKYLFKNPEKRNFISDKAFCYLTILGCVGTIIVYLFIPHSL